MRNLGIRFMVLAIGAIALAGCSHEGADWKAAAAADTSEAYQQFLKQYPNSGNAVQAQARIKQIAEDHDWQNAAAADTREAYEQFVAQHADSKWAQEARIRLENFAQGAVAGAGAAGAAAAANPAGAATPNAATAAGGASAANSAAGAASMPTQIERPAEATPPVAPPAPAKSPKPATPKHVAAHHQQAPHHAAAAAGGGSRVQLGAFHSKAAAEEAWKHLRASHPQQLAGRTPHFVPAHAKSGTLYRLQVAMGTGAHAHSVCSQLRQHGQACVQVHN